MSDKWSKPDGTHYRDVYEGSPAAPAREPEAALAKKALEYLREHRGMSIQMMDALAEYITQLAQCAILAELPAGYDVGDDATAELAVENASLRARVAQLEQRNGYLERALTAEQTIHDGCDKKLREAESERDSLREALRVNKAAIRRYAVALMRQADAPNVANSRELDAAIAALAALAEDSVPKPSGQVR